MNQLKTINEDLGDALQESKRIDHLIYVSLKYTRTADVLLSVIQRMVNFFDFLVDALLLMYQEKGDVDVIQKSPGLKCDQLRAVVNHDEKLMEMIEFYLLLRKLARLPITIENEYKRHVGRITEFPNGETITVNIDSVTEYFVRVKDYLDYVNHYLGENQEE